MSGARLVIEWEGGRRYRGGSPGHPAVLIDGGREAGPGPVDTVALALASCAAIDVVDILAKRRTPAEALRVEIGFERRATAPRRLTQIRLRFHVRTTAARKHVERAVSLSLEKYCSVSASLAPDIPISGTVEVEAP